MKCAQWHTGFTFGPAYYFNCGGHYCHIITISAVTLYILSIGICVQEKIMERSVKKIHYFFIFSNPKDFCFCACERIRLK